QQDGAAGHKKAERNGWFENRGIRVLKNWPPNSPDLSPIETLWAVIAREVSARAPFGEDDLWRFVEHHFNVFPVEKLNNLVCEFSSRLEACVGLGGKLVTREEVVKREHIGAIVSRALRKKRLAAKKTATAAAKAAKEAGKKSKK
ncbi:MAG: hypothetical protein Q9Q40_09650, partial [Acidobacteriota bacterium]|nr:hypothetical protein [Acidobacteriota bacterium]